MYKKILLSLIALYTVVGFIVVPMVLKSQLVNIVSEKTNVNLSIESVNFNPFAFKLEIIEAKLSDLNNSTLASFGSLQIDLEPHSLIKSALHLKNFSLERPKVFLTYNEDRTFNFGKLLKESLEENVSKEDEVQEGGALPRIIVDTLRVDDGRFYYEDFTNPTKFEFDINDIAFKLTDIDTNDFNSSDASIRFNSALGDGGFVDFRSKIRGFKPLVLEGSINFEASKLYSQWKYMRDKLKLEVADGKLSFGADYSLNLDDLNSTSIENMYVTLDKLRVKPKNKNNDILNLESFSATGISIKPMMQNVHVENIALSSLRAKVKRDANGEIDWIGYLSSEKAQNSVKEQQIKAKENAPWSVKVENIALKKIGALVEDRSVTPLVKTDLNELNIELKNLTLLGEEPLAYSMNLLLNSKAKCSSDGSVKHKNLEIDSYIKCSDFDIVHYQPYIDQIASSELKKYNLTLKSATAGFDAKVNVKDANSTINATINDGNFALENLSLHKKDNGERLADFKIFSLSGIALNTAAKEVSVEKAALDNLEIDVKANKEKSINLVGLVEPKEEKISAKQSSAKGLKSDKNQEKPYRAKINAFDINSAKVTFDDKSVGRGVKTTIEGINLSAKNIDSKEKSWLSYVLSLRVNNRGALKSKGEIKHTPLEQRGTFELNKLSLKEFTPYIQEMAYLKISDGFLNLKSKTAYKQKGQKHDAAINGNLSVEDFFLHDSRDNGTIASFIKANLKSFSFSTIPSALYIDEILLDSFYVDAQIDENKSMNLAKLMKEKEPEEKKEVKKSSESKKVDDEKFTFKLLNLKVSKGSANFADYSLPIDFKTHIHDLNGGVYAISNNKGEVSYVDIDGAVDEYGSAKLKGSVESSDFKAFTDLGLNFRNLSLDSFSGYSAQFAGYKIDKGKLFLDLEYKIHNSQLLGKNSLVIRNIELGDEIEDENITKLPLGFAIALLEDSEGVIDINMPVEGDLSKPDFKYGAMIIKTFANLIVKAVSAPFRFLGEMMGINGEDLKSVEFEAPEFALLPPEREKLDNIAQMLLKKPKLSLGITGGYDGIKDKKAIQSKKLTEEILKKSDNKNIVTIGILESICGEKLGSDRLKAIKRELGKKYKKEIFKSEYQKELLLVCTDAQSVSPHELLELADKRAKAVQEYLVGTKNIESSRVVLHESKEISGAEDKWVESALEIEVK